MVPGLINLSDGCFEIERDGDPVQDGQVPARSALLDDDADGSEECANFAWVVAWAGIGQQATLSGVGAK